MRRYPEYAARAGYKDSAFQASEQLFNALISYKSGIILSDASDDYASSWDRVRFPDRRLRLHLDELFPHVCSLDESLLETSAEFPFLLTAGQRRGETSNTIIRDCSWDKENKVASLYISPEDAESLALAGGNNVPITTNSGIAETYVDVTKYQPKGFVSLPNGMGLDYTNDEGTELRIGVSVNELTDADQKDF